MKRRNFIQAASAVLASSTLSAVKLVAENIHGKTSVVGIGVSGAKIAKTIAEALPYHVNYHTIVSENHTELQSTDLVNCWYKTRLQSHFMAATDNYEQWMAEDWAYNMNRLYFTSNIKYIRNRVIVVAGLGQTTGSYVSVQLIKELLKRIPINDINFVGTLPWGFEWWPFGYNLAGECLRGIEATGVKTTIYDFAQVFAGKNLMWSEDFPLMDEMLVNRLKEILLKQNAPAIL